MVDVLAISDPRRGRHVVVHWEGWRQERPARIQDHDGREWTVRAVVAHATHADYYSRGRKVSYCVEAARWRLVIEGPLPDRSAAATTRLLGVSRCS
jgi:hypothetical protein